MIEERVGTLEREQARQGERLSRIETDVGKIGSGVEKLLERDAKRPDVMTGKTVAATLLTTGAVISMLGAFVWWLIAQSPAVTGLEKRVSRLDDPDTGKVPRLENALRGWQTSVSKAVGNRQ